jgi:hypothetical protein
MPFGHRRFGKCDPIGTSNNYSCSPPGVGAVSAPSVLVFLCELFLPEGLADDSAEYSVPVDFFELFVVDGLLLVSAGDSPAVPCIISLPL